MIDAEPSYHDLKRLIFAIDIERKKRQRRTERHENRKITFGFIALLCSPFVIGLLIATVINAVEFHQILADQNTGWHSWYDDRWRMNPYTKLRVELARPVSVIRTNVVGDVWLCHEIVIKNITFWTRVKVIKYHES